MSKTYVEINTIKNILDKLQFYIESKRAEEELKNSVYSNLRLVERLGLDTVMNSVESANKLVESLNENNFKYEKKTSGGLTKLINKVKITEYEMKKLKENLEKVVNEYKKIVKNTKFLEEDTIFAIYDEKKEIKIKDINWKEVVFYKKENTGDDRVDLNIELVKTLGKVLDNDDLRRFNHHDLKDGTEQYNDKSYSIKKKM